MRILSTTIILLFTINTIKSSEDAGFTIKEVSYEIKNIPQIAENLHLNHELSNGKMTPMDLIEKVLGQKVDQNGLDEYSKMDISNGIKEQNELMDLFEKAKNSETSDQVKKDIGDGFDQMDGMNDLKLISEEVMKIPDEVLKEIKMIEPMINLNIDFEGKKFRFPIDNFSGSLKNFVDEVNRVLEYAPVGRLPPKGTKNDHWAWLDVTGAGFSISDLCKYSKELQSQLSKLEEWDKIPEVKSIKDSIDSIRKLKDRIEKMKNLDGLASKLLMMESEMKVLEQLRDSQTVTEIPKFIKKLENDYNSIKGFHLSDDALHKFKKIETISTFLEKIEDYTSYIKRINSIVPGIPYKWKSLKNHLENLKIPSESLSEKFAELNSCLEQFDFSMDFSNDLIELDKIDKSLEGVLDKICNSQKVVEMYKKSLRVRDYEKFAKPMGLADSNRLEEIIKKTIWIFDMSDIKTIAKDFEQVIVRPEDPRKQMSKFEDMLRELQKLAKIDYDHIQSVTDRIKAKSAKVEQLLKCYSDLKVVPSDIKSLMDLPKTVWSFEPNQMENTVEVVDSLKEASEIMNELKNWKFDNNPFFNEFPLNSEDVTKISDGFESLKSIENIENNWIKMTNLDYSNIEKSLEIKDELNGIMMVLESLIEQLSQMKTHLKLSDIQLFISKIQFPSNIQIDLIIDFINIKYQGNDRNGILNILEDVKYLQKNFPFYSTKLQKMNESIEKLNKWMKKEPVDEDEELNIDCFENLSCPDLVTLPEATSENPV